MRHQRRRSMGIHKESLRVIERIGTIESATDNSFALAIHYFKSRFLVDEYLVDLLRNFHRSSSSEDELNEITAVESRSNRQSISSSRINHKDRLMRIYPALTSSFKSAKDYAKNERRRKERTKISWNDITSLMEGWNITASFRFMLQYQIKKAKMKKRFSHKNIELW